MIVTDDDDVVVTDVAMKDATPLDSLSMTCIASAEERTVETKATHK